MGEICEVCKKNPAKIQIGKHSYCFDCHNKMALKDMGIDSKLILRLVIVLYSTAAKLKN